MSMNTSSPVSAKKQRQQVALWKKLLFTTVVCLAFFAIAELTLWTFGVATLVEQEDPFRGFSDLIMVFEAEGDRYRTRRTGLGTFNDQSFLTKKPANGLRLFCLGGSSSHGYPWGAEAAFTEIVGEALAASHPERHVEAVNASGVSYAMHRLNIVSDELLAYEPDVLLVYSGHNEFIESEFFEAFKRRSATRNRLEYLLAHSRIYSPIRSAVEEWRNESPSTSEQFEARVRREETRVFPRQEKELIVSEYRWRLERLVRRAQQFGVKVVLATVPCNLRDWRPSSSTTGVRLTDDAQREWSGALLTGKRRLESGDFEAAIASLEPAARLVPAHAETEFFLAQAYEGLARWDEARSAYQRACDADASPNRRVSGINEAIREVAHQYGALLVDVDRNFEQSSEHGLVGFNLIEDYVHPTREGHEIIAWHIWDAIEGASWFGNKEPASRALFDRLVAERRRRPMIKSKARWFLNQGVVLQHQGNHEAAIEKYIQALARSPGYPLAMLNLGDLLTRTGKYTEAVVLLQRLIELDPKSGEPHNNLGNALQGLGRFEEAVTHYQDALRIKPDYAEAHYNLGNSLRGLGRPEEAVTHYQDALRINPDYAEAHNNWGNTLLALRRPQEAVVHYKETLRLKPDLAEAHNNWGNALQALGHPQEAVAHYKETLRLKPDLADAHNNWGNALLTLGRFQEAAGHYKETLRLKPDFAEAHNNLGVIHAKSGRLTDAIKDFEQAVRLKSDYTDAQKNLRQIRALLQQQGPNGQ